MKRRGNIACVMLLMLLFHGGYITSVGVGFGLSCLYVDHLVHMHESFSEDYDSKRILLKVSYLLL